MTNGQQDGKAATDKEPSDSVVVTSSMAGTVLGILLHLLAILQSARNVETPYPLLEQPSKTHTIFFDFKR